MLRGLERNTFVLYMVWIFWQRSTAAASRRRAPMVRPVHATIWDMFRLL